jgi:hypothetical protein
MPTRAAFGRFLHGGRVGLSHVLNLAFCPDTTGFPLRCGRGGRSPRFLRNRTFTVDIA